MLPEGRVIMDKASGSLLTDGMKRAVMKDQIKRFALVIIIAALCIIFSITNPIFISGANILNIVRQASIMIIFSVGVTFVMVAGMIDISITGIACLSSMAAAMIMESGKPIVVAVVVAFLFGIVFGALNGFLVTRFKLDPMIVTLATNNLAAGVTLLLSGGTAVYNLPESFMVIGRGYVGAIPVQVIIMVIVVLISVVVLKKTIFGRRVYAIGGNSTVSWLAGIWVSGYKILFFIISSSCAVLAGLIMTARGATAQPTPSSSTLMDVIAAVVIGGTALSGGKGGAFGSVLGALLLTIINNGLTINMVSSYWQTVISAVILIFTIILYRKD